MKFVLLLVAALVVGARGKSTSCTSTSCPDGQFCHKNPEAKAGTPTICRSCSDTYYGGIANCGMCPKAIISFKPGSESGGLSTCNWCASGCLNTQASPDSCDVPGCGTCNHQGTSKNKNGDLIKDCSDGGPDASTKLCTCKGCGSSYCPLGEHEQYTTCTDILGGCKECTFTDEGDGEGDGEGVKHGTGVCKKCPSKHPVLNTGLNRCEGKAHTKLSKGAIAAIIILPSLVVLAVCARCYYNRERGRGGYPSDYAGGGYGAVP